MNKRLALLFCGFMLVMAARLAFGQDVDNGITWDAVAEDPIQDIARVMVAAPILGLFFGMIRILRTQSSRPALSYLRLG